ncbi:MAG TPA: hypothetical protein VIM46_02260, partial [Luteolibacter sp.]
SIRVIMKHLPRVGQCFVNSLESPATAGLFRVLTLSLFLLPGRIRAATARSGATSLKPDQVPCSFSGFPES